MSFAFCPAVQRLIQRFVSGPSPARGGLACGGTHRRVAAVAMAAAALLTGLSPARAADAPGPGESGPLSTTRPLAGPPVAGRVWSRVSVPGLAAARAVARDARDGRLALGDEVGVLLRAPADVLHQTPVDALQPSPVDRGQPSPADDAQQAPVDGGQPSPADAPSWTPGSATRRVLRRGPVHDLHFDDEGRLWVATDLGLYQIARDGRVLDVSPGAGGAARRVRRLALTPGLRAVATGAGIFVAQGEGRWSRLGTGPSGPARAVAIVPGPSRELLFVSEGQVWRVEPAGRVRREVLPEAAGSAVDVLVTPSGRVLALLTRGLAERSGQRWQTLRPALPPGAVLRRLAQAGGELFVATDRGLLRLEGGALVREASPAGTTAIADLVAGEGDVRLAVGSRGLLRGAPPRAVTTPGPAPRGAPAFGHRALAREPTVRDVHVASLRYLDLGPGRMRALWAGVRRRGWLPDLELRGAYGGDRQRGGDYDDVFVSGERRRFLDTDWDRRRDFGVQALLRWELGDVVYHADSVDVSREARSVLQLRDDVLDEVTQLYYDRRRVLLELAGTADPARVAVLTLRAGELAAGLDAWTGGWWSRRAPPAPGHSSAQRPPKGRAAGRAPSLPIGPPTGRPTGHVPPQRPQGTAP